MGPIYSIQFYVYILYTLQTGILIPVDVLHQFVAALKKVYTWIVIPVNFEDVLPSCWCTIYYF